uniref:Immunoglobulin superfamily, member 9a n=1 Tax=Cynoglossus semilaevis TaxID=244447 RepID=A0A3P8UHB0_CYNSE
MSICVMTRAGAHVELECVFPSNSHMDVTSASLHVVEWVRQGLDVPVLIKFGSYPPRVHPEYEGRASLRDVTSLSLDDLRVEDQGWYECRILVLDRPTEELKNSSWTLLSVTAPPTFKEAPPSVVEVLVGADVSLSCAVIGNPTPIITWLKDGSLIPREDYQVPSHLYFVRSVGQYTCHASNVEGNVSHVTAVKVKGPPVIVVPPKSTSRNMSQDALLRCQAVADPPNMTYVWQKDGENVHHIDSLMRRVKIMVDGTLLISNLLPEDSGNYTCMPSNGLLTPPTASAYLTVMHPALALLMPQETFLPTGLSGVVSCPTAALPPLTDVHWTKDGQLLDLQMFPGWSLRTNGSLFMATVNDDAAGVYSCTPYNSYGTMGPSESTQVILQDPPSLTIAPQKQYQQEAGTTLLIPCQGTDDVDTTRRITFSMEPNGSLLLQPLAKDHQGAWECSVENRVASVKATTNVFVLGTSPHPVSSLSVSVGQKLVNVSWEPGFDGGSSQTFSVWWVKFQFPGWFSVPVPLSSGSSVQVTDLCPATEYQISVMSHNRLGTGPFSQVITVRTLDPAASRGKPSPPRSLSADLTSRGVLLKWPLPAPEDPPITGFVLQSCCQEGQWSNLVDNISANVTELLVPGLQKVTDQRLQCETILSEHLRTHCMELFIGSSRQLEFVPEPLLAGVLGGVGFMFLLLVLLLSAACIISHKRNRRRRRNGKTPGSPDSVLKKSLLPTNNLYPTISSSCSSSSSHTDHRFFSTTDHQQHQHQQQHQQRHQQHRRCLTRTTSTPISANIELISRGPDGRFTLPQRSMSLHCDDEEDIKKHPFVFSVNLPPCRPVDVDIKNQMCDSLHRLPNGSVYTLDQKSSCDGFLDLNSLCSSSTWATIPLQDRVVTPTFPVLPHLRQGLGQPCTTASALVLQMEHERETGNLSHCLKLAQEREELERELQKYAEQKRGSVRVTKKVQQDLEAAEKGFSWEYKSSTLPHRCQQSGKQNGHMSSSQLSSSSVQCVPDSPASTAYFPSNNSRLTPSSQGWCSSKQLRSEGVEEKTDVRQNSRSKVSQKQTNNSRSKAQRQHSRSHGHLSTPSVHQNISSKFYSPAFEDASGSFRSRELFSRGEGEDTCAEMSVDDPEMEMSSVMSTRPMLHHRIASHVQHGRPLSPRSQCEDTRKNLNSSPGFWRTTNSTFLDSKQRSRSLDSRRRKDTEFPTPDAWIESLSQENCSLISSHSNPPIWDQKNFGTIKRSKSPAKTPSASRSPPPADQQPSNRRTDGSKPSATPPAEAFIISKVSSPQEDAVFWEHENFAQREIPAASRSSPPEGGTHRLTEAIFTEASSSCAGRFFSENQNLSSHNIPKPPLHFHYTPQSTARSPPPAARVSCSTTPERATPNPDGPLFNKQTTEASLYPQIIKRCPNPSPQDDARDAKDYAAVERESSQSHYNNHRDREALEVYDGVPDSGSSYSSYASSGRGSMEPANGRLSVSHLSPTFTNSPETVEESQEDGVYRRPVEPSQRYSHRE